MSTSLAYALIGIVLILLGSISLAMAAHHFRRDEDGSKRFFGYCIASVTLVYLFSGGAFCLGKAALGLDAPWALLAAAVAAGAALALPIVTWRLVGPLAAPDAALPIVPARLGAVAE